MPTPSKEELLAAIRASVRQDQTERRAPMKALVFEIDTDLRGPEGNAFVLLGKCANLAEKAGLKPSDLYDEFYAQATSGDYDNLLRTIQEWFTVQIVVRNPEPLDLPDDFDLGRFVTGADNG